MEVQTSNLLAKKYQDGAAEIAKVMEILKLSRTMHMPHANVCCFKRSMCFCYTEHIPM